MTDKFLKQLNEYSSLTEEKMAEYLDNSGIPEDLSEVMKYSVMAGGKRLRPALVLSCSSLLGGKIEDAIPFACAMEFIHTYSLIHDDLPALDNDDYRRGKLTSHKKFGEDKAILAGDALISFAFEIMLEACKNMNQTKAAMFISQAAGARGMVAGQWVDVKLNGQFVDEKTMEYIHLNKTAALIIGALKAGASCANAGEKDIEKMSAFGREIGYTFQIIDDILDVVGDSAELGKATGSDEANNKTTYVTLFGLENAKKEAERHTEIALEQLSEYGENAWFLRELAKYLLNRKK